MSGLYLRIVLFSLVFSFSAKAQLSPAQKAKFFDPKLPYKERETSFVKTTDSLYYISRPLERKFIDEVKKEAELVQDSALIYLCQNRLGLIYIDLDLFADAHKMFKRNLEIAARRKDRKGTYLSTSNLSNVYYYMGNFEKAIATEMEAFKLLEEQKNTPTYWTKLTNAYLNMGSMYGSLDKLSLAQSFFLKARESYEMDPLKDSITRAYIYNNIANTYMNSNEMAEARKYEQIAFDLKINYGNNKEKADAYKNYSGIYAIEKNYTKQREFLLKALEYTDTKNPDSDQFDIYKSLAFVSKRLSLVNEEIKYLRLTYAVKLHLDSVSRSDEVESADMRSDFRRQVVADSLQNISNLEIRDLEIKQQKVISLLGGSGLVIVGILGLIAFRRYKMTQKQKLEIEEQKKITEEKNREIRESITYARNLQDALIPDEQHLKKYFPEFFILYEPKDIVAGDFYWWHFLGEQSVLGSRQTTVESLLIAAADCTGHGVPGAMVSVVCINALNRAVNEFRLSEPKDVLMKVNELVNETFGKNNKNVNDGMDISLLLIDLKNNEVKWSGANNRLVYFDKELKEVKPSKHSIGKSFVEKKFEQFQMPLVKGSTFYLFTDGFADQFGGTKDKKMGFAALRKVMEDSARLPMQEQSVVFKETFKDWKKGFEQTDDVTVVGIRV